MMSNGRDLSKEEFKRLCWRELASSVCEQYLLAVGAPPPYIKKIRDKDGFLVLNDLDLPGDWTLTVGTMYPVSFGVVAALGTKLLMEKYDLDMKKIFIVPGGTGRYKGTAVAILDRTTLGGLTGRAMVDSWQCYRSVVMRPYDLFRTLKEAGVLLDFEFFDSAERELDPYEYEFDSESNVNFMERRKCAYKFIPLSDC